MHVSHHAVHRMYHPLFQAQHIIAYMLRLKPQQLTTLPREQEIDLLNELVTEPTRYRLGQQTSVRLLGLWTGKLGFKPWLQQPGEQLHVLLQPKAPSWNSYLLLATKLQAMRQPHGWAVFELTTKRTGEESQSRYVLIHLSDLPQQQVQGGYYSERLAA